MAINSKVDEIWMPIVGYEGLYEVSNLGNVKTLARKHRYGMKTDRILIPAVGTSGYYHVALTKDGVMKTIRVHRIVALSFIPNPEGLEFVNHKDCVKTNNVVDNLEWCDRSHNMTHAYDNNRMKMDTKYKLTSLTAKQIRDEGKWGTYKDISEKYGVCPAAIWCVLKGRTWQR